MIAKQNTCKNCRNIFIGKYCNLCGEKVYTEHDKSIKHLVEEGAHFITHFEGTFLVTLKTILTQPGQLSLDYCNGIRKKYFKPLPFFLMLIVLYLIFPIFEGLNMGLENHIGNRFYGDYAANEINHIMSKKNWTMEETAVKFHAVSEKVSKFLLFIIIPVMSLLSWPLLHKKRKLYFDHFIFATETASFFLLWGFLLLPLLLVLFLKIVVTLGGNFVFGDEAVTAFLLLLPFFFYVWKAFKRFYQLSNVSAFLYALLYTIVFILFVLVVYKFLLFLISILIIQ
jgi:hypothetical protein